MKGITTLLRFSTRLDKDMSTKTNWEDLQRISPKPTYSRVYDARPGKSFAMSMRFYSR